MAVFLAAKHVGPNEFLTGLWILIEKLKTHNRWLKLEPHSHHLHKLPRNLLKSSIHNLKLWHWKKKSSEEYWGQWNTVYLKRHQSIGNKWCGNTPKSFFPSRKRKKTKTEPTRGGEASTTILLVSSYVFKKLVSLKQNIKNKLFFFKWIIDLDRYFTKKTYNSPYCVKKCSLSLITWEMEKNSKTNYHFFHWGFIFTKRLELNNYCWVCGERESLKISGDVN